MYSVKKWAEATPPNPAMLRYIMVSEGYTVFEWSDRPGMVFPTHMHEEDQSHWVVSGALELTVEGIGTVVLGPGDRDFMPARTYHSARVISDEPVLYLVGEKFKKRGRRK